MSNPIDAGQCGAAAGQAPLHLLRRRLADEVLDARQVLLLTREILDRQGSGAQPHPRAWRRLLSGG